MKSVVLNKLLKIGLLALFSYGCFYVIQNWRLFSNRLLIEPSKLDLSQCKFDVKSIDDVSKNPIFFIKTENPTVAFTIVFRNEGSRNFKNYPGILTLIDKTLMDGAGEYGPSELKELIIDNSLKISVVFTQDDAIVTCYTVSKNFDLAIDVISDILTKSHLRDDKLEFNKKQMMNELRQSKFVSSAVAGDAVKKEVYGEGHPYTITIDDQLSALPNISKKEVDECYAQLFTADNALVTIAGSVGIEATRIGFSKLFSRLRECKQNNFTDAVEQRTDIKTNSGTKHVELDTSQTCVCFVLPGVSRTSTTDKFAARLANIAFGGREAIFNTRLFKNIRERNGFAYSIMSRIEDKDMQSFILGNAATRPENTENVIRMVREECQKFASGGISDEELEYCKTAISSRNTIASAKDIVDFVNTCRLDLIPVADINESLQNYYKLTKQEVNDVIRKVFDPLKMTFITVGKKNEVSSNA